MTSETEEMLKLLFAAKSNELGLFPFNLRDVYRLQDRIPLTESKFIEITNSLMNHNLIEMSGTFYKLNSNGFKFVKKLENDFVNKKILADLSTEKNITISDVISRVEKYYQESSK